MAATSSGRLSRPARRPPGPAAEGRSGRSATATTLHSAERRDHRRGATDPPDSYAGGVTAAALDSTDVAASTLRTTEVAYRGDLTALLPADGGLSWTRRGEGLVGWGERARLEVTGPSALADAAAWWDDVTAGPAGGNGSAVPGRGPVVFASIAFDPAAGTSVFVVPEVVVGRRGRRTWVTTDVDREPAEVLRPQEDEDRPAPQLRYADGAMDPASWCAAVGEAVRRIEHDDLAKVVLARDLLVAADGPLDPRRLLARLAARFPDCWTFAVDGLLGATPELLLRRTGRELSARVLAGTAPRGAGDEDIRLAEALLSSAKDRAEHALAVRSLVDALLPFCADLDAPAEPDLLTLANVRHLATDVTGTQRRDGW